jgi:hypothetical protein
VLQMFSHAAFYELMLGETYGINEEYDFMG